MDERTDVGMSDRMYEWASGCMDALCGCMNERSVVGMSDRM